MTEKDPQICGTCAHPLKEVVHITRHGRSLTTGSEPLIKCGLKGGKTVSPFAVCDDWKPEGDWDSAICELSRWVSANTCVRDGAVRCIYRKRPSPQSKGSILFRHHWQTDEHAVLSDLMRRPYHFADNQPMAEEYKYAACGEKNYKSFLVRGVLKRDAYLADIITSEIFHAVHEIFQSLLHDDRFQGDPIGAQRWLPTEVANRLREPAHPPYDGIWDDHGNDILLDKPLSLMDVEIVRI